MPIPVHCSNFLVSKSFNTDHDFTASFTYTLSESGGTPVDLNGFSMFFVDSEVNQLQGGGSGPGLGVVTDTTTSSSSAISGLFMTIGFDVSGYFAQSGAIPQFTTGEVSPLPKSLTLRITDFQHVTSIVPKYDFIQYDKDHQVRVRFRKQFTVLHIDFLENGSYTNYYTYQTQLSSRPYNAKMGIGFSGDALFYLGNLTMSYYPSS